MRKEEKGRGGRKGRRRGRGKKERSRDDWKI